MEAHDLLQGDLSHASRRKRRLLKRVLWTLLGLFGALIVAALVLVVPSVGALKTAYAEARTGREALFRAKDAAERFDFTVASSALSDAVIAFDAAHAATFRLGLLSRVPPFKDEVGSVRLLLLGGRDAALALREAVDVGAEIVALLRADPAGGLPTLVSDERKVAELSREERRVLLQKMIEAPDRLGMARDALDRALSAFDRVGRTPLTVGLLDAVAPQVERLRILRAALDRDLTLLGKVPSMLGYPAPKRYLFLLLNNTELRPGGGFIGTYGVVELADGGIERFFTDDIYGIDGPAEARGLVDNAPPEPLRRWLRADAWYLRDANWSPDFAVSAMNVERLYRLEGGTEEFDGVIGVTPTYVSRLLMMTGPIAVGETTFDAANVTDELEYQVEKGFVQAGIPLAQRKEIIGRLGQVLLEKLLALPLSRLQELSAMTERSIDEKQVMLSFDDPPLQRIADERGWSGRMTSVPGDELLVVDANLASLKTDPAVERTIAYSLRPEAAEEGRDWIARAEVTYRHRGTFNWKTTRYRTYTRFYVPIGSEFLKGEGMMQDDRLNDPARRPGTIDAGEDLGRTVFGGFISIEPGETRSMAVEYRVSDAVRRMLQGGAYDLHVRKQLGAADHALTLDLDFDKNVVRAEPPEEPGEWGDGRYKLVTGLRTDRHFEVEFEK
jgi:hypothetical protein